MKWYQMNYRHAHWRDGYRYFARWHWGQGYGGTLGPLRKWLEEQYGPARIDIQGPLSAEQMSHPGYQLWHLGRYPNPHWGVDTYKKRVYVTEETLAWARLSGRCG